MNRDDAPLKSFSMTMTTTTAFRTLLLAALTVLACAAGGARAQAPGQGGAPAPVAQQPAPTPQSTSEPTSVSPDAAEQNLLDRKTQKIERLRFEDSGNRVEELRVGGQTRRITVRPKDGAPVYEVQPTNPNIQAPDAGIGQTGPRVWRIHEF